MVAVLDVLTTLAFLAISFDIVLQIIKVYSRKSSADISIKGCVLRLLAISTIWFKFFSLSDFLLVAGQGILISLYIIYLVLLIKYRKKR